MGDTMQKLESEMCAAWRAWQVEPTAEHHAAYVAAWQCVNDRMLDLLKPFDETGLPSSLRELRQLDNETIECIKHSFEIEKGHARGHSGHFYKSSARAVENCERALAERDSDPLTLVTMALGVAQ